MATVGKIKTYALGEHDARSAQMGDHQAKYGALVVIRFILTKRYNQAPFSKILKI